MSTSASSAQQESEKARHQRPFAEAAPMLAASLLVGAGGGLVLATVLTVTQTLRVPLGAWWSALAQAHGHLQIYGWIGLFVLGVALYFLPRLRGTPLAGAWSVPWLVGAMVGSLALRTLSQPLTALTGAAIWRVLLVLSGVGELGALLWIVVLLFETARVGVPLHTRPALWGVLPFVLGSFIALGAAGCANLANMIAAARAPTGLVPVPGDSLNIVLGLFGFLVPMALAMSARTLPMYAGLDAFPRRAIWPLAGVYLSGTTLVAAGTMGEMANAIWSELASGLGMFLIGGALVAFVGMFLHLMRSRGRLPLRVRRLAPVPTASERAYRQRVAAERAAYGPFVALIASAYLWALLGGVLLCIDGACSLLRIAPLANQDAARHSLALGFIALLLSGVAPRLIPGFAGGKIRSPALVTATLWLGNAAAVLRVVPLLAAPALATLGGAASMWGAIAFGLSGPFGLALGICLAINLWPALFPNGARR